MGFSFSLLAGALSSLLTPSPASAGITKIRDLGTFNSKTAGTTLSVTLTRAVAAGNSIIVTFAMDDAAGAVTCADNSGGPHTYGVDVEGNNASNVRTVICSAHDVQNVSSGTIVTVSHPSATARAMSVVEFHGLDRASPLDQIGTGSGSSPNPSSGAANTTVAKELLVGAIGVEGPVDETFTPGASWTSLPRDGTTGAGAASNMTVNPEYRVVAATGSYQADGTITSRDWAAVIATYKEDPVAMNVGATGTQAGSLPIPSTHQYVGGAFTFLRGSGTTNVTQIVLSETNTINANANLANVKIYFETAATCTHDGNEPLFGTAASFDGSEKATITAFAQDTVTFSLTAFLFGGVAAIDSSDNLYAAGSDNANWLVAKFDSMGSLDTSWGNGGYVTYDSGGGGDTPLGIVADASHAIYVAGEQQTNGYDFVVRKYDANGNLDTAWGTGGMVTYNSGGVQEDRATGLTIDPSNNIYVAGSQQTNGRDFLVRKYDASGNLDTAWGTGGMVTYNSGGTNNDGASDITIDSSGNIYVAGTQWAPSADWMVRKYDVNGNLDTGWGTGGMVIADSGTIDRAAAITIDFSRNIYVTGDQGTNGDDWAIRKWDANGNLDTGWGTGGLVTYNSGGSTSDYPSSIVVDSATNIYVAGYQYTNGIDWAIRKYDADGNLDTAWGTGGMVTYNSTATNADRAQDIVLDSAENLVVLGTQAGPGFSEWAIRKYTGDGTLSQPLTVGTSQVCLYVVLDVGPGASAGELIDIEISDPCTEVTVSTGYVSPCTAVALPATTTRVTLMRFEATGFDGAAHVEWETGSEIDNLGFHLYRSTSPEGPYSRITQRLISGLGSSPRGATYSHPDPGLANALTYYYKLEDVETTGRTSTHGPVSASPRAGAGICCGGSSGNAFEETRITVGEPGSSGLRVLEERPGEVLLELATGGFYAVPRADGTFRLEIPGFDLRMDSEGPSLPVRRSWVEAIAGRRVELVSIESLDQEWLENLVPVWTGKHQMEVGPDGVPRIVMRRRARSRAHAHASELYPAEAAKISAIGFQGDVKKALVELAPLQWHGPSGRLRLTRLLRVRLAFRGRETAERAIDFRRGRRWSDRPSQETRRVLVRLATREPGLHEVSFEEAFGWRTHAPVEASSLRLSRQGEAVAFHLQPDTGWFGPGIELYFVSEGAAANPHGDEAVHELEAGSTGMKMPVHSALPRGKRIDFFWQTVEREENLLWQAKLVDAPDRWLWRSLLAPARERFPFEVNALAATAEASRLEVWLQGITDFPADPDHHMRLYVNGFFVAEARWDGAQPRQIASELETGVLHEGENLLEIENVGDTGSPHSMVMLDRFQMSYPRLPHAAGGRLQGRWSESGTAEVMGLGQPAAVLEMTDSGPVWLTGAEATGATVRFGVESGGTYLAVGRDGLLKPRIVSPPGSRLTRIQEGAEYLLIGPGEFVKAAASLVELRESEGLRVLGVAVEDVYSEFGFGESRPGAIRDFLAHAYHLWRVPPKYVLLLGDASYDFKDHLRTGVKNRVPPMMVKTTFLETASDPTYGAVNGEDTLPDLAIGRLPAATTSELATMIEKILAFESSERSLGGLVALIADNPDSGGDFVASAESLAATVLRTKRIEKIYLSELDTPSARAAVRNRFEEGSSLVSYIGHGGIHVWAGENLLQVSDVASLAPQAEQPLVLTMNCLNGYFHFPYFDSLAEALVKADGRGAIAALAPSGLSLNGPAHRYHEALLKEILGGNHERLGDAILAAQSDYADSGVLPELLSIFHLLGDPALRLR